MSLMKPRDSYLALILLITSSYKKLGKPFQLILSEQLYKYQWHTFIFSVFVKSEVKTVVWFSTKSLISSSPISSWSTKLSKKHAETYKTYILVHCSAFILDIDVWRSRAVLLWSYRAFLHKSEPRYLQTSITTCIRSHVPTCRVAMAGLEKTAGQRTMSRMIGELTGQPFVLPVMLTSHIRSYWRWNKLKFPCCSVVSVVISM